MGKKVKRPNIELYAPEIQVHKETGLYHSEISAGFPSPAEDFLEKRLDLNEYLIRNPAATFLVKVVGDSMVNAGISEGDILVVDRSAEPTDGKIILAVIDGEFTVKRIRKKGKTLLLLPDNEAYSPIEITEAENFQIWGVVTYAIHKI